MSFLLSVPIVRLLKRNLSLTPDLSPELRSWRFVNSALRPQLLHAAGRIARPLRETEYKLWVGRLFTPLLPAIQIIGIWNRRKILLLSPVCILTIVISIVLLNVG